MNPQKASTVLAIITEDVNILKAFKETNQIMIDQVNTCNQWKYVYPHFKEHIVIPTAQC